MSQLNRKTVDQHISDVIACCEFNLRSIRDRATSRLPCDLDEYDQAEVIEYNAARISAKLGNLVEVLRARAISRMNSRYL